MPFWPMWTPLPFWPEFPPQSWDEAQDEPSDGRPAEQEPTTSTRPSEEPQRRQDILRNRAPGRRCEYQNSCRYLSWPYILLLPDRRLLKPTRTALLQYVRRVYGGAGPPCHRPSWPWQLPILPRRGLQHAPGLRVRRQRLGRQQSREISGKSQVCVCCLCWVFKSAVITPNQSNLLREYSEFETVYRVQNRVV